MQESTNLVTLKDTPFKVGTKGQKIGVPAGDFFLELRVDTTEFYSLIGPTTYTVNTTGDIHVLISELKPWLLHLMEKDQ
jgi:hypothetical protein